MNDKAIGPGLCLVIEMSDGPEAQARIADLVDATTAVTLILTPPGAGSFDPETARPVVKQAQDRGVAVLFVDDAEVAREVEADGVHLTCRSDIEVAYGIARGVLGTSAIVGVEAGALRHDAMALGEAGADYIAFSPSPGETDASEETEAKTSLETQAERIAWWSDLFVVPCVALGVQTADEAARLSQAGADFIAVHPPADLSADALANWARSIVEAVHIAYDAA